jgi:hypothetical protein
MHQQEKFPRTTVDGVSLPRMLVGTNWFLGWSHTSLAKDNFIKEYQTRERIVTILKVFLEYGIDTVMRPPSTHLDNSIREVEQQAGRQITLIYTPAFDLDPDASPADRAEAAFDQCAALGATF